MNAQFPIYDSKVFKYLKNEEGVDFWDIQRSKKDIYGNEIHKLNKIEYNWEMLKAWDAYNLDEEYMPSPILPCIYLGKRKVQ